MPIKLLNINDLTELKDFICALGLTKGLFIIFFIGAHSWIYNLYAGRLKDRQSEINRLAEDNHELRNRLLALLDKHFNYKKPKKH